MGRFYQTARPEFVDNFIYEPPWEQLEAGLLQKDEEISKQMDTIDFYRNVPMEYAPWDKENVLQAQEEIAKGTEELAADINANLLNPENASKLNMFGREVSKKFMTGDLATISENAREYKKYQENYDKLQNPAAREMYKAMIENHVNEKRRLGGKPIAFKSEEMYDPINLTNEFLSSASFTALKPDVQTAFLARRDGRFYDTKSLETQSIDDIRKAFKGFVENNDALLRYFKSYDKYDRNSPLKYLKNGFVSFDPGSKLAYEMENLAPYEYKKETIQTHTDPYTMRSGGRGGSLAKKLNVPDGVVAFNKSIEMMTMSDTREDHLRKPIKDIYKTVNVFSRKYNKQHAEAIAKGDINPLPIYKLDTTPTNVLYSDTIAMLDGLTKKGFSDGDIAAIQLLKDDLKQRKEAWDNSVVASWDQLQQYGYKQADINAMKKTMAIKEDNGSLLNIEGVVDLRGHMINLVDVKNKGVYVGENGLQSLIGSIVRDPDSGRDLRIGKVIVHKGSTPLVTGEKTEGNYMISNIELVGAGKQGSIMASFMFSMTEASPESSSLRSKQEKDKYFNYTTDKKKLISRIEYKGKEQGVKTRSSDKILSYERYDQLKNNNGDLLFTNADETVTYRKVPWYGLGNYEDVKTGKNYSISGEKLKEIKPMLSDKAISVDTLPDDADMFFYRPVYEKIADAETPEDLYRSEGGAIHIKDTLPRRGEIYSNLEYDEKSKRHYSGRGANFLELAGSKPGLTVTVNTGGNPSSPDDNDNDENKSD